MKQLPWSHFFVLNWKCRVFCLSFLVFSSACQQLEDHEGSSSEAKSATPLCSGTSALPDIENLPIPQLRTDIGTSYMKVTTSDTLAQKWFNQGLNLLHGFWHVEAYRAFQRVIELDPSCAMGYWGIAMCQPGFGGNQQVWKEAIQEARKRKAAVTQYEADFIEASYRLINDGIVAAVPSFELLMKKYPDDPEALAFASLMMRQTVTNEVESEEVRMLLEDAMKRFPDHSGLQHYYVHTMEVRSDFVTAKPIAQRIAAHSPGISHLLHMPGHIYFLEGEYQKAAVVFEQARAQERLYHVHEKIPKAADQNYMHNLHYLAVTYTELDEYEKALEAAKEFAYITLKHPKPKDANGIVLLYEGRILPVRVHIRFGEYAKAIEQLSFWLHNPDFAVQETFVRSYLECMLDYCQSMEALFSGDRSRALQFGRQFNERTKTLTLLGRQKQGTEAYPLVNKILDIVYMSRFKLAGWIDNIDPNSTFNPYAWDEAFKLEASLPYEEPPRILTPVGEELMRLHRHRGEIVLAEQARDRALKVRPKSKRVLRILNN